MKRSLAPIFTLLVLLLPSLAFAAQPTTTVSGIPLDAPWKVTIYQLVRSSFAHPAWGWQHAERDYDVALELAKGDGLKVDTDVLFAAAMLHDMEAFPPYSVTTKEEHGDVAARESEPILRKAGFPMAKFPAVQAAMRGHMFYSDAGARPEAIVLHDADSLDFLGAIGAVRIIALTGEKGASAAPAIAELRTFLKQIPPRLITKTAKKIGAQRAAELRAFLDRYDAESDGGKLP
ncbi:MAG: metal-dependent phosphohydrolase [bacterium]|nr:metal-dependent phosphohydrolase [bacterium]